MGGKKVTTGYWYHLAWHDGLCLGPLDAYLEFRPGTKPAWSGRAVANQTLYINSPELWGGEKDQGGVVGPLSLMFGEPGQTPNPYLVGTFGSQTVAWRGVATVAFEGGKYGANNPYAQKRAHKVERIKQGWDGTGCWYPAKAAIPMGSDFYSGFTDLSWTLPAESGLSVVTDEFTLSGTGGGEVDVTLSLSGRIEYRPYDASVSVVDPASPHIITAASDHASDHTTHNIYKIEIDLPPQVYYVNYKPLAEWTTGAFEFAGEQLRVTVANNATVRVVADPVDGYQDGPAPQYIDIDVVGVDGAGFFAKNPAHMILWAHTQQHCGAQPMETVHIPSLTAAADWFYAKGFGLCTLRYPDKESAAEFIRRIERVAGCSWTQNRGDGLWYLDIINGEYDYESLPILTDDDIVSFEEIPTVLDDAVNSVSVKYFDPQRKEAITTRPLTAMALVAEFGTTHQTFEFPELPIDSLANRVADRELRARATPTRVFTLATTRKTAGWRRNTYFRLQLPKRGIADMVCLLAEINSGSLKSGAVQIKATQDIYSLAETAYTETEVGVDTRPPATPVAITQEVAFEAPLIDLAATLSASELADLPDDAGYVVGVAANPGGMRDFTMMVAPSGGGYSAVSDGEFSPTATAGRDVLPGEKTAIPVTDAVRLADVQVGDLMLWVNPTLGDELCRVDAVDATGNTLDLGRGCGDTVPKLHLAGSRMFFYQSGAAYDATQYISGESINVKLLTNSYSARLPESAATALGVTFARRADRPYPPANIKINGMPLFDVDSSGGGGGAGGGTGGGGGGGGGGTVPTLPPASTPSGSPASPAPGPNGGYPDDAPYPVPEPTVFGSDVVGAGGDFSEPADLSNWRDGFGNPLDNRWSIVGGRLCFYGQGAASAYYWPALRTLALQLLPHYSFSVTGTAECDAGAKASLGVGRSIGPGGSSISLLAGYDPDAFGQSAMSDPVEYGTPTAITHVFEDKRPLYGVTADGVVIVSATAPGVLALVEGPVAQRVYFDDVAMAVTENAPATTTATLANLDFSSGLSGWVQFPEVSVYSPSITTAGGVATFTPVSVGVHKYLICEDPITDMDAIDKWLKVTAEVNCNDPTVFAGVTRGGVGLSYAVKLAGEYNYTGWANPVERGDWTTRSRWIRQRFVEAGATFHVCVLFKAAVGYSASVRNISAAVTNAPVA